MTHSEPAREAVAELLSHLKLYVVEKLEPADADMLHDRMYDATNALSASPAATSAETQGGDGVREAHQIDGLSCEYDDGCYTLTWADGRWLTAHTNGTLVAGKSPRQDDIPAVKTSIAALAPSTSAATRGDGEQYRSLAVGLQLERDQAQSRLRELEDKLVDAIAAKGRADGRVELLESALKLASPAPAVESAQLKEDRTDG